MPRKATRNAPGSGTIRQRKDGTWEARFTVGRDPGTGRQLQKSVYGKTRQEVAQKLRRAKLLRKQQRRKSNRDHGVDIAVEGNGLRAESTHTAEIHGIRKAGVDKPDGEYHDYTERRDRTLKNVSGD